MMDSRQTSFLNEVGTIPSSYYETSTRTPSGVLSTNTEKLYSYPLDEKTITFTIEYPSELHDRISRMEFDAIFELINGEMTAEVREVIKYQWNVFVLIMALCLVFVGIFLTPFLFVMERRQKMALKAMWSRIEQYFLKINKKTYYDRDIEWKVVMDEDKYINRDVVHPLLALKIILVKKVPKAQRRSSAILSGMMPSIGESDESLEIFRHYGGSDSTSAAGVTGSGRRDANGILEFPMSEQIVFQNTLGEDVEGESEYTEPDSMV